MTIRTLAAASLAVMLLSTGAHAAGYLKIGDIKGEATDKGQIEIQSFSWGASNAAASGASGMNAGRVAASPPAGPGRVTVTTAGAAACAKGKHFPTAVLTARTGSYTLEDVTVSACDVHGDPHVMEMSYGKASYSDLSITSAPSSKRTMAPASSSEMSTGPAAPR
ncbi:type VI secretion system tube protein Hcp [Emcibacter sp. SYSU 3D8]|uniref:type VI secretion system tube protein Hcp n=1 Tax=Emcibacter sp. SYSU 3D8 TaxID=3133969 RepID=UPI0031FE9CF5